MSSAASLTIDTLQYRLATGNLSKQGGQKGSLTRCVQKLGRYQSQRALSDDAASTITQHSLLQDLELFRLELCKLMLLQKNLREQVKCNEAAEKQRQEDIQQWSQQVQASQSQANRAQETKACVQEYERLTKKATEEHPESCRTLQEQLDQIQIQGKEQKQEYAATQYVLQIRERQLDALLQHMRDLETSLQDPQEHSHWMELALELGVDKEKEEEDYGNSDGDEHDKSKEEAMEVDGEEALYGDI